jgi:hypothetical protein
LVSRRVPLDQQVAQVPFNDWRRSAPVHRVECGEVRALIALARAWRWQKLLDRGVHSSVTEIAEAEKLGKMGCPGPAEP